MSPCCEYWSASLQVSKSSFMLVRMPKGIDQIPVKRKAKPRHPWRRQVKCIILQVPMAQSVTLCILSLSSTPRANRDSFLTQKASLCHRYNDLLILLN